MIPAWWQAFLYLVAFGLGTVLAMGAYSVLAATAAAKAASSLTAAKTVALVTAFASLGVGVWWVARAGLELARR